MDFRTFISLSQTKIKYFGDSYVEKGFESRREYKGISLIAYIKGGIVVKTESGE